MRVKLISKISAVCLAALACILLFGAGKTTLAASPTTINFQGKVVNSDGTNVTNGTYSFIFRIYNTSSPTPTTACSGDATCLYEETQSSVTVTNGTFQVELGSTCAGGLVAANTCTKSAAGGLNFSSNNALYLTLQFNGDSSGSHGGFMWPVIHLTSVPYAYYADNAGSLGGISSNNFVQFATGTLQADSSTNNSISVNKTGVSGDILLLEANSKKALEVDNSGTTLLGQAGASGLNGTLTFNNAAGANTVSLSLQANPGSSYTLLLPTTGPSTSQCLETDSATATQLKFTACNTGLYLSNIYDSAATTGNTITLASTGGPVVVQDNSTPLIGSLFTVMGNACVSSTCKYLDVSASGVAVTGLTVNGNTTVAAGDYIKITGSGTRPSSPAAGTLYYDTSTNTLLTYNGSKWMSDKSAATKTVAMGTATGCTGTSPVASTNPDGADYVVTSCTDAAGATNGSTVNTINAALQAVSSAGGGTVYLEEGTYIVSTNSISIPDNVTLAGAGAGTIIKFKDTVGSSTYYGITNSNTASGKNVTIRNLSFDGNLSNNSVLGTFYGIYLNGMTATGQVLNTTVKNVSAGFGIALNNSSNVSIIGDTSTGNSSHGIYLNGSSNNTVTNNLTLSNSSSGIALVSSNNNVVNGNQSVSNTNYGMFVSASSGNVINGNTLQNNGSYGIFLSGSSTNQLASNKIMDSGGALNNGIYLQSASTKNTITGNDITDSSCATSCYAINITDAGSINNYISSNRFLGDGTHAAAINNQNNDSETLTNQQLTEKGDADFINNTNSATAFQIQTAGAVDTLLSADTSANKIIIGNATGTNTSTTLLVLDSATADPTTGYNGATYYNTTSNTFRCYVNGAWKDCAGGSLSSSYNSAATTGNTITLASAGGPVVIQDNSTPLTGSLFTVMGNACVSSTCKYLDVSSSGIAVTGLTTSGNISLTGTGSFDQSASSGTFKTGTGAVSLNGTTTVAQGNALNVGTMGTSTGQLYVSGSFPNRVGNITSASNPFSVYVQGRYAYMVNNTSSGYLRIYDVSNPASPFGVGSLFIGNSLHSVYVQGRYAYVVTNTGLGIYDVSNPASPTLAGSVNTIATGASVYVQGRYAYVAMNNNPGGLYIYDISNPASPFLVSSVNSGALLISVYVQGRYAYVADFGANKLDVDDISNPANPINVASVSTGASTTPYSVYVSGRYAYVIYNGTAKLQIFDVSTPTSPATAGSVSTVTNPLSVYTQGNYAYVTGNSFGIYNVSNPSSPTSLGSGGFGGNSVFVSGRYAYVADSGQITLDAYDLGGGYVQQLQAGGTETGTLQVDSNGQVAGNFNVQGGLQVGESLETGGNLGIAGAATLQGPVSISGGKNQLGPPTSLSATNPNNGTGSLPAGTYYYEVTAVDANGDETTVSNESSGVTTGANLNLNLSWTAPTGGTPAAYKIYRATTSGGEKYLISVTGTSYNDTGSVNATNVSAPTIDATGQLTVQGSVLFRSTTNSTTAFQVQNATGIAVLALDTSNDILKVYDSTGTHFAKIYNSGGTAYYSADNGVAVLGNGTGAVSVTAGSGAGVTITGNAASSYTTSAGNLTLDSGGGTLILGSNTTTLQKSATALTLDVTNASNSTLNVSNSAAGAITLNLDSGGSYAVGGAAGTTASACSAGQFVTGTLSGGIITSGSCAAPTISTTLQNAYDNSSTPATITTSSTTKGVLIQAGSTFDQQALFEVANSGSLSLLKVDSESATDPLEVQVGSSSSPDSTLVNLGLDNYNAYADAASSCGATNNGSLYYNTVSNSIRACINAGWEDLVSTGGLGIYLFGVVSDSANAGTIGDIGGASGNNNSPCKVYWSATQQVTVAPCTAYSGGRKVIVASTAISTAGLAASTFANVCLDGANNQPQLETGNTTESSAAVPAWSANNPVLCLATVKTTTTAGNVGNIWDIRTFTNTQKTFVSINAASALGVAVVQASTAGTVDNVAMPAGTASANVKGVIIARNSTNSSTTPNAIVATQGPQWVKATAGGTSSINGWVETGATTGYTITTTTAFTTTYADLGVATRTIDTACSAITNCQYSQFLNPLTIR